MAEADGAGRRLTSQPPPQPISALQAAQTRRKKMLMAFAGVGSACLSLRVLAAKLIVSWGGGGGEELLQCIQMLLLYHPSRYEDDMDYQPQIEHFQAIAKQRISYRLDKVFYSLQSSWGGKKENNQQALLIHPEGPATGGLWAVFGGNAMLATDWIPTCWQLLQGLPAGAAKPAFLLVDYPGYGANDGSPSPKTVQATALAAVRAAYGLLASPKPAELHLLGHSLGTSAATQLASRFLREARGGASDDPLSQLVPGRLVLSAPFTSLEGMGQRLFSSGKRAMPLWMLRPMISHKWDTEAWIPQAATSGWNIAIIHGQKDTLVPIAMGKALEAAAQKALEKAPPDSRGKVTFKEIRNAGHNDVMGHIKEYSILMGFTTATELS